MVNRTYHAAGSLAFEFLDLFIPEMKGISEARRALKLKEGALLDGIERFWLPRRAWRELMLSRVRRKIHSRKEEFDRISIAREKIKKGRGDVDLALSMIHAKIHFLKHFGDNKSRAYISRLVRLERKLQAVRAS